MPALKTCSNQGCPNLIVSGRSRCQTCDKAAEDRRGTPKERGYGPRHQRRFRPQVLRRDPICVCVAPGHDHPAHGCYRQSTVADHWPLSRRELVERGMDPDDPAHGRGLCKPCHDRSTARAQPGGWNRP